MTDLHLGDIIPFPKWEHPTLLESLEGRIDSALSSSNRVLNTLLSPVRTFVHDVLHPIFYIADHVIGIVWDGIKWVFSKLEEIAWNVIHAFGWVFDHTLDVVDLLLRNAASVTRFLVDNAAAAAQHALDGVRDFLSAAIDDTRRFTSALVSDIHDRIEDAIGAVLDVARQLVSDAISFLGHLIDDVKDFAGASVDYLVAFLDDAIDALIRDVIHPVAHRLDAFIDEQWHWARDLLQIVDHVADWLLWIDRRVVGDVKAGWAVVRGWADMDFDEIVAYGVRTANSVA